VASARSTKQVPLLFQCEIKHEWTFCSFIDGHRSILTDHDIFSIPPEHCPPCAADDLVPPETWWMLRDDGWIWQFGGAIPKRRVCWLPPAYRPLQPRFNRNIAISRDKVILVTDTGRLVFVDLKRGLGDAHSGS
jgi:hypothetical protein